MIYKQCKFTTIEDTENPFTLAVDLEKNVPPSRVFYGIAVYNDYCQGDFAIADFEGVICGECGEFIDADSCLIIETLDNWWSLEEAIADNFTPDDVRGFRPENQISMKFD